METCFSHCLIETDLLVYAVEGKVLCLVPMDRAELRIVLSLVLTSLATSLWNSRGTIVYCSCTSRVFRADLYPLHFIFSSLLLLKFISCLGHYSLGLSIIADSVIQWFPPPQGRNGVRAEQSTIFSIYCKNISIEVTTFKLSDRKLPFFFVFFLLLLLLLGKEESLKEKSVNASKCCRTEEHIQTLQIIWPVFSDRQRKDWKEITLHSWLSKVCYFAERLPKVSTSLFSFYLLHSWICIVELYRI